MADQFDVIIIGSGFGGSVSALRLAEKGYRVCVLEAGRRFADQEFPKTSWNLSRYLFFPILGCYGLQRFTLLKDIFVLSGAGVGGGSLVYANTLYEAPDAFYQDPQWCDLADWKQELAPHYQTAKKMLGVQENPWMSPADHEILTLAKTLNVESSFRKTPVGVFFGEPGVEVQDPYFNGNGPNRKGCLHCGECMTGCRHNAKNTLVKNYLYFAEKYGVKIIPLMTAKRIQRLPNGEYQVVAQGTGKWMSNSSRSFRAKKVIVAAGTLETQRLLHFAKLKKDLPLLSNRLGEKTRTNSEAILGARSFKSLKDFSKGVAITSSIYLDANTHLEPVRYGKGSNLLGMISTVLTDVGRAPRVLSWLLEVMLSPNSSLRNLWVRRWSEQSIIALIMQSCNNSLTLSLKKYFWGYGLTSHQGLGEPNPVWIPIAHKAVRLLARQIKGVPLGALNDVMNIPTTAHFIGGCPMGKNAEEGVIDSHHQVHGYPGLYVMDGSAISANLGVNPSLTIAAMAERAVSVWPQQVKAPQGEKD